MDWFHTCEELTHWKRLWCWEGLGAGGEGDHPGWDGWMASRAQWMWVWVNSRRWWWTGRPGMLQFMGLLWVGHDWATGLIWTELCFVLLSCSKATQLSIGKSKELPSQWINNQVLHHHSLQRKFLLKLKAKLKQRAKTIKLLWVHLKHKCLPSTWEENVFTC